MPSDHWQGRQLASTEREQIECMGDEFELRIYAWPTESRGGPLIAAELRAAAGDCLDSARSGAGRGEGSRGSEKRGAERGLNEAL